MRLEGKVSIITGGAQGIGLATAEKFAAEGARVVICDVNQDVISGVVNEFKQSGIDVDGFNADVTNQADISNMVDLVISKYGQIDCLVNNAGIVRDARMVNMTEEQFDSVIDVNLKGTYNCAKSVFPHMMERQSGVVLNASSIVGIYGNFGQTNYAASKFGVIGMAKTWAREFGRFGIRVNAVCPGMIKTDILSDIPDKVLENIVSKVPMGRLGAPSEIANTYAFLASDEASYINGAVIEVGGGATL
ncbi:MAG: 3-oxoacyl-ACP reductase FabG [Betaproteobacteria bacterium]|jgi:3-oxoacyl-[acyl-carrier protein] reductase